MINDNGLLDLGKHMALQRNKLMKEQKKITFYLSILSLSINK